MNPNKAGIKLPFRPGVGMMIINKDKKVFVAKRKDTKLAAWQMPQGGINPGETPSKAALRETIEEIGTDKVRIIAETRKWYSYDIPEFLIKKLWDGKYRGQRQKWFLMEFIGKNEDINIKTSHPEFTDWRWAEIKELPEIIVQFKRRLYEEVTKEFEAFM